MKTIFKRILKCVPVFLVCLILAVSSAFMAAPVSAATDSEITINSKYNTVTVSWDGDLSGRTYVAVNNILWVYFPDAPLPDGFSLDVSGSLTYDAGTFPVGFYSCVISGYEVCYEANDSSDFVDDFYVLFAFENSSSFESGLYLAYWPENSNAYVSEFTYPYSASSDFDEDASSGIYQSIFDLLHTHIYGGAELTSDMNLVLTLVSTMCVLFVVALPFLVVFLAIRWIGGR